MQDALKRKRAPPRQAGLSAKARRRNGVGAFEARKRRAGGTAEQSVLLVDGALTTGATATACVPALRRAGASDVDLLVLARVVRAEDVTI